MSPEPDSADAPRKKTPEEIRRALTESADLRDLAERLRVARGIVAAPNPKARKAGEGDRPAE